VTEGSGEASTPSEPDLAPRFVLVWLLILVLVGLLILLPETTAGRSTTTIFTGLVLAAAVRASRVRSRAMTVAIAIVAAMTAAATLSLVIEGYSATTADTIVMTVFTLGMPVAILSGLRGERTINIQTVFGAVSLYFMLGLLFAFLISTAARFTDQPYFAQGNDGSMSQRVYFSYVTLATLGYGDLTPATSVGRLLAVLETIAGSLYLVTAVSLVVTRLGHVRPGR
jgi:Ion channel